MGIKSFFGGLGRWLFGKAKDFFDRNRDEIIGDLEAIAKAAVLSVPQLLTKEARATAVDEIIRSAKATGAEWGNKLLAQGEADLRKTLFHFYAESDLKRYLGLAKLTVSLLEKTTLDKIPSTHVLLGLIQAALMDLEGS